MRILITGGYGFIGGRLAEHLSRNGHTILIGSRFCDERKCWIPKAKCVLINISDHLSLENACKNVDVVIHALGMNAQECQKDPSMAIEVNAIFPGKLINAAKLNKVKRFIYLSTAQVYSSPLLNIIDENTKTRNTHPYATSNLAGEHSILSENGIETCSLRISNSFGPPIHKNVNCWHLLINNLCRQAIEKQKIILRSDPTQLRDFITLTDLILAIEYFIKIPLKNHHKNIFNIGGEFTLTLGDIADLVAIRCFELYRYKPIVEKISKSKDFSFKTLNYKINKLKSTGFILGKKIEEEIDKTLFFCKKNYIPGVIND